MEDQIYYSNLKKSAHFSNSSHCNGEFFRITMIALIFFTADPITVNPF
jgi:hypothetical protein